MLTNISKGRKTKPLRVVLYGVEGIGKSTFAANAPKPIFICAENGTGHLDIDRYQPKEFGDVIEFLGALARESHDYQTIVIDTLDWLEPLVLQAVCKQGGKRSIDDFAYGKGFVLAVDLWRKMLTAIEALETQRKMHSILIAHAAIKRVEDPYAGSFDRYRMKIHEKAADLIKEWSDAVLFARHEVFTADSKNGRSARTVTGERVIHTQWTAAFDAKNRFSLPETISLDWRVFQDHTEKEGLINEIRHLAGTQFSEVIAWCHDDVARMKKSIERLKNKENPQ